MAQVIPFPGITCIEEAPEVTLEKAKSWGLTACVIAGLDENGKLQFGGSLCDSGMIMLILEAAKSQIVEVVLK